MSIGVNVYIALAEKKRFLYHGLSALKYQAWLRLEQENWYEICHHFMCVYCIGGSTPK